MSYCPCCSNILLQHLRGSEVYWFCRHCWQEMPVWEVNSTSLSEVLEDSPRILQHQKKASTNVSASKRKSRNGWIGVHDIPA
ncbi:hypothetical protein [Nostoc sp. 106C]|jgi:DNA-directed RNA polymerase subunit M/transcription elongation factor TFIIS|uniref:hypothetical protein n=1 Tax=Nostoc sp. 106C TaxID=1932667 RepID=UPI000A37ACF8|nr:hypothetical protein [Nostoc sp. 106C]OUL22956.1 hypothetical protein BV378_23930 [Nostoc sp. RF31YmG]OUL31529.1 hypothetical protein BV375_11900 [Nostoc sp. 106C]